MSTILRYFLQGDRKTYTSSATPLTDGELDKIAADMNLGRWNFYGALYGPQPVIDGMWKVVKASFTKISGAKLYFPEEMPDNKALQIRNLTQQGIPSLDELKWVDWMPNGAHLFFSPIAKMSGNDAVAQYTLTRRRCREFGFDFVGAFAIGQREMHHIVCVLYDRKVPDQRRRAHQLLSTLIEDAMKLGWGEYRTHLAFMDQVANTYAFNNNALMKLNETLKDCLDPKGILAPGKNGVWPKSYDKEAWKLSLQDHDFTASV